MVQKSETIINLSKAMAEFQKNLKQPLKDANNPFFKSQYVPLENVVESITTAAGPLGLSFTQYATSNEQGNVEVGTVVMHSSGEWIEYPPVVMKPEQQKPQAIGSAITYAKRYALSAIFGITSDKDDDGNEANGLNKQSSKPAQRKQAPKVDDTHQKALAKWDELLKLGVDKKAASEMICQFFSVGTMKDVPADKLLQYLTTLVAKREEQLKKQQEDF